MMFLALFFHYLYFGRFYQKQKDNESKNMRSNLIRSLNKSILNKNSLSNFIFFKMVMLIIKYSLILNNQQHSNSQKEQKLQIHLKRSLLHFYCFLHEINKFMFITTQPFHQKRNFKFSSQLAGKTYNNRRFLSSCSYIDSQFKLSTAGSEEENTKFRNQKIFIDDLSFRKTAFNRDKQVHSAAEKVTDQEYKSVMQPSFRKSSMGTDRRQQKAKMIYLAPESTETKRTSLLDTALTMVKQIINVKKSARKKSLKRKLAFNPHVDTFYSPFIDIRIVDKIKDLKELEQKSIKVNFEKIYKKLIKTQLMGQFTANFMETVERYIHQIIENGEMYENPFEVELSHELKTMSRKQQFLQKLIEFWGMNQTLKIRQLVKFYCIPSQETSDKILVDLMMDLVIEIYEKKCCNRDIEYALLTVDGTEITHISQIYFSTQELLMIPKANLEKNYHHYCHLIEQRDRSLKMNMRQSIRHNFVQKIVNNQIDDKKINYQQDPHNFNQTRRDMVEHATLVVQSKSKYRLQAKKDKGQSQVKFDELMERRNSSRNDNLFTNYIIRKQKQKKQYGEILFKLRQILDPGHKYNIKSKLDQRTEEQFRKVHLYNDKYDITYNHNKQNSKKMFLINMIQNCEIFKSKNTEQVEKILSMIEAVYGMGMDNINEIHYWQFKEIYETAHGVSNKDVIMKFVLNYLVFDEYGEMQRDNFFQLLDICLSHSGRPLRLIKQNIWNLFQSMKLVQNNALRKQNLSIWYQPVKVVYLLLLSIIFGRQYESLQEMALDLLKYYND